MEPEFVEGVALEAYEPPTPPSLFGTNDPVEVIERSAEVARSLNDVIQRRHLYQTIQGKQHVLVEGWQLLGSMLGVTAVCVGTEEVEGGWKATVEARTADGRVIGRADALCTRDEKRGPWKSADDYARLSMAQTRATSKALKGPLGFIISMAGYSSTPAEEAVSSRRLESAIVGELIAARQESGVSDGWMRAKLTELGVNIGPDAPLTRGLIRGLSEHQANALLDALTAEIEIA